MGYLFQNPCDSAEERDADLGEILAWLTCYYQQAVQRRTEKANMGDDINSAIRNSPKSFLEVTPC